MKNVNISNTLWNDTSEGTLGFACQIKDNSTPLENYSFVSEEDKQHPFQSNINKALLDTCETFKEHMVVTTVRLSDEYPGLLELIIEPIFND